MIIAVTPVAMVMRVAAVIVAMAVIMIMVMMAATVRFLRFFYAVQLSF